MHLAIYLTAISTSVLPTMAICALSSVVSAGTANPPVGYGRLAAIGALIGMAFGIAGFYLLIMLTSALAALLPPEMGPLAHVSVHAAFGAVAAAVSALTTAPLVTGSGSTAPPASGLVVIGGAFGLVAGIANAAIGIAVPGVGVEPTTDIYVVLAMVSTVAAVLVVAKVVADVVLAMLAFWFVRRRWGVVSARSD